MPYKPVKQSNETPPPILNVVPLTARTEQKRTGRPRKPKLPPTPDFGLEGLELQWYDYFIQCLREENPDLTGSDEALLPMMSLELIKYMRLAQHEIASKELISQARQHPLNQLARLYDMLDATRKARRKNPNTKADEDDWTPFLWKDKAKNA